MTGLEADLAGHFKNCAGCQAWRRLLVHVDSAIVNAPVPASDGKAKRQLLAQFRPAAAPQAKSKTRSETPSSVKKVVSPIMPAPPRRPLGERLAKLWPAGLVAAGLLVVAIGWTVFSGKNPDKNQTVAATPDPLLEKAVSAKVKLDSASSPAEKVAVLDDLAKGIHSQAESLARVTSGNEMESLAKMYEQVVADGLVAQARAVPREDREKALAQCRDSLTKTQQDATRLAGEAPAGSVQPLKDIARIAAESRNTIAQLMQQGRAS
jgi:hypothetical protein